MAAIVPYSEALRATNSFCADVSVWYGPLLPFLLLPEESITLATRSFAEVIAPGDIDELNGPVESGRTLVDGRDLLSLRLKYCRIDMTNLALSAQHMHVFAHEMI